ncbi:hypothetical protein GYH30_048665 [Glycine max]|nr:hypothetical protein GYH30_048665 [Glycine max]
MLYITQTIAGVTTISKSCPLLSLAAASAITAISLADASEPKSMPDAPSPSPSPMMTPLLLRMRFSWFSAGCRMLNSTHTMAGINGNSSASPRLSPSAISAICDAAKAASQFASEGEYCACNGSACCGS